MGSAAVQIAWTKGQRRMLPLAVAPFLFGLQQACEGLVWLEIERSPTPGIGGPPDTTIWAALAFLFFAYAFWPVWMPLAAVLQLPRPGLGSSRLMQAIPLLGLLPGCLLWLPHLRHPQTAIPVQVGHSLVYGLPPWSAKLLPPFLGPGLYSALIVIPLLLVPSARVRSFGLTLLAAFALTEWATSHALTSVWCYVSALLSAQILWILQTEPGSSAEGGQPHVAQTQLQQ